MSIPAAMSHKQYLPLLGFIFLLMSSLFVLLIAAQQTTESRKHAQLSGLNWTTPNVQLTANDFSITVGGKTFTGNDQMNIHSDPGNNQYTTLELTWFEQDVEMGLNMYFSYTPNEFWRVTEMRTYDGNAQGNWKYFDGFIGNVWGNPFISSVSDFTSKDGGATLHFTNLHLLPFISYLSPSLPVTPPISGIPTPTAVPGCVKHSPEATLTPLEQTGTATQTLAYQLNIKNTNSSSCPPESWTLSGPTDVFSLSFSETAVHIVSGGHTSVTVSVTPRTTLSDGDYPFTLYVSGATAVPMQLTGTFTVSSTVIENPPSWWFIIPQNLRNFLELLYTYIFFFGRTTNMGHLLEGIPTPQPTPTPTPLPRVLQDTRERLLVLGGSVGSDPGHIDSVTNRVDYFDSKVGFWQSWAPMKYKRHFNTAVALGKDVYVFGPAVINQTDYLKAEVYRADTNVWEELAAPPDPKTNVTSLNAFAWGDRILLVIQGHENSVMQSVVYSYNVAANTYQRKTSPVSLVDSCGVYLNKIYCFERDNRTYVHVYTPKTDAWERHPVQNPRRPQWGIIGSEFGLYTISVDTGSSVTFRSFTFDTNSNTFVDQHWGLPEMTAIKPVGFALEMYGSGMAVISGQNTTTQQIVPNVWLIDPAYGLSSLPAMPVGHFSAAAVSIPLAEDTVGAKIGGTITEASGSLTTKVTVSLAKITGTAPNGGRYWSIVAEQNLDSTGKFSFPGLDPGDYTVMISGDYNLYTNSNIPETITLAANEVKLDFHQTAVK